MAFFFFYCVFVFCKLPLIVINGGRLLFIYVYCYNTASTDTSNNTAEHNFRVLLTDSTVI